MQHVEFFYDLSFEDYFNIQWYVDNDEINEGTTIVDACDHIYETADFSLQSPSIVGTNINKDESVLVVVHNNVALSDIYVVDNVTAGELQVATLRIKYAEIQPSTMTFIRSVGNFWCYLGKYRGWRQLPTT